MATETVAERLLRVEELSKHNTRELKEDIKEIRKDIEEIRQDMKELPDRIVNILKDSTTRDIQLEIVKLENKFFKRFIILGLAIVGESIILLLSYFRG